jgi:hypothetical protein
VKGAFVPDVPVPVVAVVLVPWDVVLGDEVLAGGVFAVDEFEFEFDDELLDAVGLAGGLGGGLAGGVLVCVCAGLIGAMCSGFLIGFGSAAATAGRVSARSAVTRAQGARNRISVMIGHLMPARKVRSP